MDQLDAVQNAIWELSKYIVREKYPDKLGEEIIPISLEVFRKTIIQDAEMNSAFTNYNTFITQYQAFDKDKKASATADILQQLGDLREAIAAELHSRCLVEEAGGCTML